MNCPSGVQFDRLACSNRSFCEQLERLTEMVWNLVNIWMFWCIIWRTVLSMFMTRVFVHQPVHPEVQLECLCVRARAHSASPKVPTFGGSCSRRSRSFDKIPTDMAIAWPPASRRMVLNIIRSIFKNRVCACTEEGPSPGAKVDLPPISPPAPFDLKKNENLNPFKN